MNKIYLYIILGLVAVGLLYYFFGETGMFAGLFGSGVALNQGLKVKQKELEEKSNELKVKLEKLKEKVKVDDLSPDEEVDYWKDE